MNFQLVITIEKKEREINHN